MFQEAIAKLIAKTAVETVSAHCDGPCGVYDPASARIAAEAALSMTKKIIDLGPAESADHNTYSRFVSIKEQQAHLAKEELLILWTDYFKPEQNSIGPARQVLERRQAVFGRQAVDVGACNDLGAIGYPQRLLGHGRM